MRQNPYYTPQEIEEAIRLHDEDGLTWKEVAGRTGRSFEQLKVTVRDFRAGKLKFKKLNGERRTQEILAAARSGESARAIAERFGARHRHILAKLAYHGVSAKTGGDPALYSNKMVAAVVGGTTPGAVAKKFRIGLPRVLRLLEDHGLMEPSGEAAESFKKTDMKGPAAAGQSARADYLRKRASILHLADLKRAGHSRFDTELHIPSDDIVLTPPVPASFVPSSSSLALL